MRAGAAVTFVLVAFIAGFAMFTEENAEVALSRAFVCAVSLGAAVAVMGAR